MKINRYKKANKRLGFFVVNFGFRKPFQLLIDGTFCYAALQNQVQIKEEIPKYLGGNVKLLTTQCVIMETEKLGAGVKGAMLIAKSFGIHHCQHKKNPVTGAKCLLSMIGENNPNRYIIATQDPDLQEEVQRVPGAPLLYFNRTSAVLKPPSEISVQVANKNKESCLGLTEYQEKVLTTLKKKTLGDKQAANKVAELECIYPKVRKGPNPLSCKKRKRKVPENEHTEQMQDNNEKPKKKRKRLRLAKHVKEVIFSGSS